MPASPIGLPAFFLPGIITFMTLQLFHRFIDRFTDCLCALSLIGIWPRFIEPLWLEERHETCSFNSTNSPPLKIAHLSDLHWNRLTSSFLIKKIQRKLQQTKPDIILFTGDFLSYSEPYQMQTLQEILKAWRKVAPIVACLGNHDYSHYVTQRDGNVRIQHKPLPFLLRAFKRLLMPRKFFSHGTHQGLNVKPHSDLLEVLKKANVDLLVNEAREYKIGIHKVTILGVGDLWADNNMQLQHLTHLKPTIILAHNPDSLDHLEEFDTALVLCGHTHGGNVNLKGIRGKIRSVSHINRLKGWQEHTKHHAYVNRGLGNPYPFRFFSRPELTWIHLYF